MLLVDTNVLLDVVEDDPDWATWSISQLRAQSQVHELLINPPIYAELSLVFRSVQSLDAAIDEMGFSFLELPRPALLLAGRAFLKYRHAGGLRSNVLGDFLVGAHAAVLGCGVLTRDAGRYRTYFPTVPVIAPG